MPDWQRSIVRDFWHTLHCVVVLLVLSNNDVATDFGDDTSNEELVVNLLASDISFLGFIIVTNVHVISR